MTKPHFRIRSDGWIVHDGGECPVALDAKIVAQTINGITGKKPAFTIGRAGEYGNSWVNKDPAHRITAYRLT